MFITKHQSKELLYENKAEFHNGFMSYIPDVCTTAENKKIEER